MNAAKFLLVLGFLIWIPCFTFAGENTLHEVTQGVCNCLEACKKDNTAIQDKSFQTCIQKAAKPYIKELKKMYQDKNDPDDEQAFAEKLAMQLGLKMASTCPAMLEFILEEFPGLLEEE
jgi:hypothetical protein